LIWYSLADVAEIGAAQEGDVLAANAFLLKMLAPARLERLVGALQGGWIDRLPGAEEGLLQLVLDVGLQHSPGGEGAGVKRHDHLADLEFLRERDRVHRAGAAIGEEREVARVDAAPDGDRTDGVGHAGIDDG